MDKNKLFLILMALCYSITLGSLVYIWPRYKELFVFIQIIILPAIYAVGFEILMDKQKNEFEKDYKIIVGEMQEVLAKNNYLENVSKRIKYSNKLANKDATKKR